MNRSIISDVYIMKNALLIQNLVVGQLFDCRIKAINNM